MVEWGGHHGGWGGALAPSYIVKKCLEESTPIYQNAQLDIVTLITNLRTLRMHRKSQRTRRNRQRNRQFPLIP
jgi:hypothetical protein